MYLIFGGVAAPHIVATVSKDLCQVYQGINDDTGSELPTGLKDVKATPERQKNIIEYYGDIDICRCLIGCLPLQYVRMLVRILLLWPIFFCWLDLRLESIYLELLGHTPIRSFQ